MRNNLEDIEYCYVCVLCCRSWEAHLFIDILCVRDKLVYKIIGEISWGAQSINVN